MTPVLLLCLAAGTVLSCIWLWLFRQRIALAVWAILPLALLHTLAGVLCVKLFAGLESFRLTLSDGMSLYGGIFLLPIFYACVGKLTHRKLKDVFDVMALCMVSTLLFARGNCIVSGCCQGLPLPGASTLCWPTREVEMVFHGVLLVLFYRRLRRQEQPGTIYPLYMMAYGIFRFVEEWLREGKNLFLGLHPAHFWSILSIVIGCSFYFELTARSRRKAASAKKRR